MKQLTCEMCGSADLLKQDGVFVCQSCGMKYSVEEAKKMMIEGTVDVQGTVKVDISESVEKYLVNARRAKEKEDWEEVEKYYNMVEQNDPNSMEAIFYSAYAKVRLSMLSDEYYKREQICSVLCKSISVIYDNYNIDKSEENEEIIMGIHSALIDLYFTNFLYGVVNQTDFRIKTYTFFARISLAFIESLENILEKDDNFTYLNIIYNQYVYLTSNIGLTVDARNANRDLAIETGKKLREREPDFPIDEIPVIKKEGCYVATAVYGSYDCPQVWTLRRYRDYTLAKTWHGRMFIKTYYAISPTLVKWFGHTEWFKKMWRGTLDRMVANLQVDGVESTPYEDKIW